jgi:16S rRNA G966 N2-methylase RsmD
VGGWGVEFFKRGAQVMHTVENSEVSRKQAIAPYTSCGNSTVIVNKARNKIIRTVPYWSFQIIYSKHLHFNFMLTV